MVVRKPFITIILGVITFGFTSNNVRIINLFTTFSLFYGIVGLVLAMSPYSIAVLLEV